MKQPLTVLIFCGGEVTRARRVREWPGGYVCQTCGKRVKVAW